MTQNLSIVLVIEEPTEYVDRSLATASWWDRYTLLPGTYVVEWEVDSSPGMTATHVRRGAVKVDAVLEESYRVNTLYTASSAHTETPKRLTTLQIGAYPWVWLRAAAVPGADKPEGRMWGGNVTYAAPLEVREAHTRRRGEWLQQTGRG